MTSFGDYIKREREKREWTQSDFGSKIGINTSAISRIEHGSQKFSKTKLKKLAELFDEEVQLITDLFFADKFAMESYKYRCSDYVFKAAEKTAIYIKNKNSVQGKLDL